MNGVSSTYLLHPLAYNLVLLKPNRQTRQTATGHFFFLIILIFWPLSALYAWIHCLGLPYFTGSLGQREQGLVSSAICRVCFSVLRLTFFENDFGTAGNRTHDGKLSSGRANHSAKSRRTWLNSLFPLTRYNTWIDTSKFHDWNIATLVKQIWCNC